MAALDLDENMDSTPRELYSRIAEDHFHYPSYHALFDVYAGAKMVDPAWCVASTLSFLERATEEEQAYAARYRRDALVRARDMLSADVLRRHVAHPDQDPILTGILGVIAPAVAGWRAVELPGSLNGKDRIDIATDPSLFSCMAKYVRGILDVTKPDLYVRPDDLGDVVLMNIKRKGRLWPSMVAFNHLLRGKSERYLAFALGRTMMDLYPPNFCFLALDRSPQALKQVVLSCLHWAGLPAQGDRAAFDQISREIVGRMPQEARDRLRGLIDRLVRQGSTDMMRWAAATELTGCRVGLLLCGDIRIASRAIALARSPLGVHQMLSPRDLITELVLHGISEDYFAARRALGIQVTG